MDQTTFGSPREESNITLNDIAKASSHQPNEFSGCHNHGLISSQPRREIQASPSLINTDRAPLVESKHIMKNIFYMNIDDLSQNQVKTSQFTFNHKQQCFKSIGEQSRVMTMDFIDLYE